MEEMLANETAIRESMILRNTVKKACSHHHPKAKH